MPHKEEPCFRLGENISSKAHVATLCGCGAVLPLRGVKFSETHLYHGRYLGKTSLGEGLQRYPKILRIIPDRNISSP